MKPDPYRCPNCGHIVKLDDIEADCLRCGYRADLLELHVVRGGPAAAGCCFKCGHDLKGFIDAGCPECGWNRDDQTTTDE